MTVQWFALAYVFVVGGALTAIFVLLLRWQAAQPRTRQPLDDDPAEGWTIDELLSAAAARRQAGVKP